MLAHADARPVAGRRELDLVDEGEHEREAGVAELEANCRVRVFHGPLYGLKVFLPSLRRQFFNVRARGRVAARGGECRRPLG